MKKIAFIFVLFVSIVCGCNSTKNEANNTNNESEAINDDLNAEISFDTYCNSRYDYCIDYPAEILIPQPESDNGDGRVFESADKTRKLTVWGEINILEETLEIRLADDVVEIEEAKTEITDDYYIIKGKLNGNNYFQKTKIIDGGFATFIVQYPEDKARSCNKVISRMTESF